MRQLVALVSASVALSNAHAGARPVRYTVSFTTQLQCGRLVGRAVVLGFPRAVRLPAAIRPAAVLLTGGRAGAVDVAGRRVTVAPLRPTGVICNSITEGTARVVFTAAAGIGNPRAAGTYVVTVTRGGETQTARLRIRG